MRFIDMLGRTPPADVVQYYRVVIEDVGNGATLACELRASSFDGACYLARELARCYSDATRAQLTKSEPDWRIRSCAPADEPEP